MIRKRTFNLVQKTNISSWASFEDAYKYIVEHKTDFEKTFEESAYDKNFEEPMNVLTLTCDSKNIKNMNVVNLYAEKINEIFADKNDKIVITTQISCMPFKYKNRVYIEHTWFKKEFTFHN
jgi:hypothetical protein